MRSVPNFGQNDVYGGSSSWQGRANSESSLTLGLVPLVVRILINLYYPEFLYHSGLASVANVQPLTDSRKLDNQSILPKRATGSLTNHPFSKPPHRASQARLTSYLVRGRGRWRVNLTANRVCVSMNLNRKSSRDCCGSWSSDHSGPFQSTGSGSTEWWFQLPVLRSSMYGLRYAAIPFLWITPETYGLRDRSGPRMTFIFVRGLHLHDDFERMVI